MGKIILEYKVELITFTVLMLVGICLVLWVGPPAWAQPSPVIAFENLVECTTLQWDAVTTEDLSEYRVYLTHDQTYVPPNTPPFVESDGTLITFVEVESPDVSVACDALDFQADMGHLSWVTAVDLSGNESGPSNVLSFMLLLPDTTPPDIPSNYCMTAVNSSGETVLICPDPGSP